MDLQYVHDDRYADLYSSWTARAKKMHPEFVAARNQQVAFNPLRRPLSESRVAIVASGGIRLTGQDPFDLRDPAGDWTFRAIPADTPASDLVATHAHYDTDYANQDIGVMFPLDALHRLVSHGVVGSAANVHYGAMGFIPQSHHVVDELAPAIVSSLRDDDVDLVVLVPG